MKLQTPKNSDAFLPPKPTGGRNTNSTSVAKSETVKESAAVKSEPKAGAESRDSAIIKAAPAVDSPMAADPVPKKPTAKGKRKTMPKADAPVYKINLNCTLAQRDSINATADSLGMTTTAYLLGCENIAVHQLVKYFTAYIDTRDLMTKEKSDARLLRIEELLKGLDLS
jgi:hypothetical protein